MIPKAIVMDIAEKSGFGGSLRPKFYPRLQQFAEMVAEYQRREDANKCNQKGLEFSAYKNEFMDGKMDGAFLCAEIIMGINHDNT